MIKKVKVLIMSLLAMFIGVGSIKAITIHNDNAGFVSNYSTRVCNSSYCTNTDSAGVTVITIATKYGDGFSAALINRSTYEDSTNQLSELNQINGAPLFVVEDELLESPLLPNKQENPNYRTSVNSYMNYVINDGRININTEFGRWLITELKRKQICGNSEDLENITSEDIESCRQMFVIEKAQKIREAGSNTKDFYQLVNTNTPIAVITLNFGTSFGNCSFTSMAAIPHVDCSGVPSEGAGACAAAAAGAVSSARAGWKATLKNANDRVAMSVGELPAEFSEFANGVQQLNDDIIDIYAEISTDDSMVINSYVAHKTLKVIFLRPNRIVKNDSDDNVFNDKISVTYTVDGEMVTKEMTDEDFIKYLEDNNKITGNYIIINNSNFYNEDGTFDYSSASSWINSSLRLNDDSSYGYYNVNQLSSKVYSLLKNIGVCYEETGSSLEGYSKSTAAGEGCVNQVKKTCQEKLRDGNVSMSKELSFLQTYKQEKVSSIIIPSLDGLASAKSYEKTIDFISTYSPVSVVTGNNATNYVDHSSPFIKYLEETFGKIGSAEYSKNMTAALKESGGNLNLSGSGLGYETRRSSASGALMKIQNGSANCGDYQAVHEALSSGGGYDPGIHDCNTTLPGITPNPDLSQDPIIMEPSCCGTGVIIEFENGEAIDDSCKLNIGGKEWNLVAYLYQHTTVIDAPCSPDEVTAGQPFNWGSYIYKTMTTKMIGPTTMLYSVKAFYEARDAIMECLAEQARISSLILSSALNLAQNEAASGCTTCGDAARDVRILQGKLDSMGGPSTGDSDGKYKSGEVAQIEKCIQKLEEIQNNLNPDGTIDLNEKDIENDKSSTEVVKTVEVQNAVMEFNGKTFEKGAISAIAKGTGKFLSSITGTSIPLIGDFVTEFVSGIGNLKGTLSVETPSGKTYDLNINCKFCSLNKLTEFANKDICDNVPDCTNDNCDEPTPKAPDCTNDNCVGDGGLNIVYRTISLTDPFPNDREPSLPWNTSNAVEAIIKNGRGASGYELYTTKEPMYTIKLTATDIRKIREYNKTHSYNDFDMTCKEVGLQCISEFIHTTFRSIVNEENSCAMNEFDWYNCYEGGSDGDYANYLAGFQDALRS